MLYVSTRNKETFTPLRAISDQKAPDGGIFVPLQLQQLPKTELLKLYKLGFHDVCAYILNQLLDTKLSATDIEFSTGRNIVSFHKMNHKMIVAELWRNLDASYSHIEKSIYNNISEVRRGDTPTWIRIAIRIAVLFGIYTQLHNDGLTELDIAVYGKDCTAYMAAFYARMMGLPLKTIIIGCDERSGIWDLIQKGEYVTASATADVEPLVYATLGHSETNRLLDLISRKRTYFLDDELLPVLSQGFFAAVVGSARRETVISSVWRTNKYVIDSETAVSYSALQDYRARTGESRDTLIFADTTPLADAKKIQSLTHLSYEQLNRIVSISRE